MKIQLDTDRKTIKIESDVLLSKLIQTLDKLLPNKEWKQFTLQTNTTISYWNSPVIIKEYPVYPTYPKYPNPWPWYITCSNQKTAEYRVQNNNPLEEYKAQHSLSAQNTLLKSGVFNIEV